jgi:transposase
MIQGEFEDAEGAEAVRCSHDDFGLLDNHSAHLSRETRDSLNSVPQRFVLVFTPTHGSRLNLVENRFSQMTRSMLRVIRVASKQELIDRIHQYFAEVNADRVVFRWRYKWMRPTSSGY